MRHIPTLACLAALALPGLAQADDYYLRAALGRVEPRDGLDFNADSQASAIGVGWRFSRHFSLEAGANDLGDYAGTAPAVGGPLDARAGSLELGLAAKLPFGRSDWFGQARAGAHRWEAKLQNFETSSVERGTDAYYGLGLGYDVTELFSVVLSYERYLIDRDDLGDMDRVMIGFELR